MTTVLVADDDADFRELVRIVLESLGSDVLEAADFSQAVDVARAAEVPIALVLLDYFMPGDRETAVEELRKLVGERRLILATACDDPKRLAGTLKIRRTLPKPVDLAALEAAVRSLNGVH
ncbi:MAG: response regulator [Labilithrix sp.]|nr:response regulator [Labilithrix sp.]